MTCTCMYLFWYDILIYMCLHIYTFIYNTWYRYIYIYHKCVIIVPPHSFIFQMGATNRWNPAGEIQIFGPALKLSRDAEVEAAQGVQVGVTLVVEFCTSKVRRFGPILTICFKWYKKPIFAYVCHNSAPYAGEYTIHEWYEYMRAVPSFQFLSPKNQCWAAAIAQ